MLNKFLGAAALCLAATSASAGFVGSLVSADLDTGVTEFNLDTDVTVIDPGNEFRIGVQNNNIFEVDVTDDSVEVLITGGVDILGPATLTITGLDFSMFDPDAPLLSSSANVDATSASVAGGVFSLMFQNALASDFGEQTITVSFDSVAAVPLPASMPLLAAAGLGLFGLSRRRRG